MASSSLQRWCLLVLALARSAWSLPVPRDVYTFWHSGALPDIVVRCIESWRVHCRGCQVHVITLENVAEYVTWNASWISYDHLAHVSDLIRTLVLVDRGGIYLDASVAATDGSFFEHVFQEAQDGAVVLFDLDMLAFEAVDFQEGLRTGDWSFLEKIRPAPPGDPRRIPENWGMGAASGSPSMRLMLDEVLLAFGDRPESPEAYCAEWKRRFVGKGEQYEQLATWLPYLWPKATFVSAMERGDAVLKAQPAEENPFLYLRYVPSPLLTRLLRPSDYWMDGTGLPVFALGRSLGATPGPPSMGGLVKFRGLERDPLRHVIACGAYANDSPLRALLQLPAVPVWWPVGAVQLLAGVSLLLEREPSSFLKRLSGLLQALLQLAMAWGVCLLLPPVLLAVPLAARRLRSQEKIE